MQVKNEGVALLSLSMEQSLPYPLHAGLSCFGEADEQHVRLQTILSQEQTRICIAVHHDTIVGYATLLLPEPEERWASLSYVRMMGALEVAPPYRFRHIASAILQKLFQSEVNIEQYIVLAFEYYWHWDLQHGTLDVYEYKRMLKQLLVSAGMEEVYTDDPDIQAHSANFAMARIGASVSSEQMQHFFYTLQPRIW